MAVFILRTHYPSGRTWANILQVMRLQYKDGHKTHYASRRTTFRRSSFKTYFERIESSSRRIIRLLVPVFILETHNQTNYKCFSPGSSRRIMRPQYTKMANYLKNEHLMRVNRMSSNKIFIPPEKRLKSTNEEQGRCLNASR